MWRHRVGACIVVLFVLTGTLHVCEARVPCLLSARAAVDGICAPVVVRMTCARYNRVSSFGQNIIVAVLRFGGPILREMTPAWKVASPIAFEESRCRVQKVRDVPQHLYGECLSLVDPFPAWCYRRLPVLVYRCTYLYRRLHPTAVVGAVTWLCSTFPPPARTSELHDSV